MAAALAATAAGLAGSGSSVPKAVTSVALIVGSINTVFPCVPPAQEWQWLPAVTNPCNQLPIIYILSL